MVVIEKYPNSEIHSLLGKQILTKGEKITDNAIVFLTDAPFEVPEFLNGIKNADKEFYLVNQSDKQFFVIVTDEFIESRQLAEKIIQKLFRKYRQTLISFSIIKYFLREPQPINYISSQNLGVRLCTVHVCGMRKGNTAASETALNCRQQTSVKDSFDFGFQSRLHECETNTTRR